MRFSVGNFFRKTGNKGQINIENIEEQMNEKKYKLEILIRLIHGSKNG
jgi:hypothetical protein